MIALVEMTVHFMVDGGFSDIERDVQVRASTFCERQMGGCFGASIDGDVEFYSVERGWVPLAEHVTDQELERIEEALCDAANEDDASECVDHDDFERDCAQ